MSTRVLSIADHLQAGGAAGAAWYLNQGLSRLGYNVLSVVGKAHALTTDYSVRVLKASPSYRLWSSLPGIRRWATARAGVQFLGKLRQLVQSFQPQIVHLHNVHGFESIHKTAETIFSVLPLEVPIVWTLHDMWSFTGRCGYSFDCQKFIEGCDARCPTPHEYVSLPPAEIGPAYWRKASILSSREITAVCPTKWLANVCRLGLWRDSRIEVIPYGIDTKVFSPMDREEARQRLGLTMSENVLLAMAANWRDPRKGGAILAGALRRMRNTKLTVLVAGKGNMPSMELPNNVKVRRLGFLRTNDEKVTAYNAADLLVNPSLADNLPLVILEAQACGLPAVVFNLGGMPEAVASSALGQVIERPNEEELGAGIQRELELKSDERRNRVRELALARYSIERQARDYSFLFEDILRVKEDPLLAAAR